MSQPNFQLGSQLVNSCSGVSVNILNKNAGAKMSILRNVDISFISTCSQLRALIRDQLRSDITEGYLIQAIYNLILKAVALRTATSGRKGNYKLTLIPTWTVVMKTIHPQRRQEKKIEYRRLLIS